jgi:ubiquinone/menaquinone biosynthesis C-methylase UbiE
MDRLKELQQWSYYEFNRKLFVEPSSRHQLLIDKISDVVNTYNPRVIVKAGLGSDDLLLRLVDMFQGTIFLVVEPSWEVISDFIQRHKDNEYIKNINFVNGDFKNFPIDYYAAHLIISIDNLDVQETAPVIEEFRRALQFDSHLLLAGIVLDDGDIDGLFDDFLRGIFPLHNDFYIREDLKTFLNLKEFSFIKGKDEFFEYSIDDIINHVRELYGNHNFDVEQFIEDNKGTFIDLYQMNNRRVTLPYFTGLFMRRRTP